MKTSVSIIIDNYNYGQYLEECIKSALNQTYRNIEVLVVDDGSTDNSRDIIETFSQRVTVVLKENGGQTSAFNEGYSRAKGELVIFLDSDDILYPHAVETVVSIAEKRRDEKIAKIQYQLDTIDSKGKVTGTVLSSIPDEEDILPEILQRATYRTLPSSGNAFHRCALEKLFPLPDDKGKISGDANLLLGAPFFGRVITISQSLGAYRIHDSNNWFYNGSNLTLRKVRYLAALELKNREFISKIASSLGLKTKFDTCDYFYHRLSLSLYRIDRESYIELFVKKVSPAFMVLNGCRAVTKNQFISQKKKAAYILWFLMMLFPGPISRRIAFSAFRITNVKSLLKL